MRTYTAHTREIDDVQLAVEEIIAQLPPLDQLAKNTLGIVGCFADFVSSGVVAELSRQLPFEIIGTTTLGAASPGELSETILTLMVLSSDEVSFVTALTEPIPSEDETPLATAYQAAVTEQRPVFIISCVPLLLNASGDFFVEAMDNITNNLPNFGALAVDHNADYHEAQVLYNGAAYRDRYAFALVCGEISPRFFVGTLSDESLSSQKGVVTAAQGNQLQAVNGISLVDFCKSIGLQQNPDGTIAGINSFPLVVDYNDGTQPAVRSMFATTPEGYAVCGGRMPVGSTISISSFDSKEVLSTTRQVMAEALRESSQLLIFSCVGRYFAQGFNPTAELEAVQEVIGEQAVYQMTYCGGEICPVIDQSGQLINRAHNDSIIICAF